MRETEGAEGTNGIDDPVSSPNGLDVVIIDDHDMFSMSLAIALGRWGIQAQRIPVAGLEEFAQWSRGARPGVVVLDLHLGASADGKRIKGSDWIARLVRRNWQVLAVTGSSGVSDQVAAIAEGAAGVLSKTIPLSDLVDAVIRVTAGDSLVEEDTRRKLEAEHEVMAQRRQRIDDLLGRLTVREREVLEAIAQGLHATDVAKKFGVAVATVRSQIRSILRKLEVNSQIEAVATLHQQVD